MPSSGRHYPIALNCSHPFRDFGQKCSLLIRPNKNLHFPQSVLSGFFTLLETLRSRFGHLTLHTAVFGWPYHIGCLPKFES